MNTSLLADKVGNGLTWGSSGGGRASANAEENLSSIGWLNADAVLVDLGPVDTGPVDAVVLVVLFLVSGPIGLVFSWLVVVFALLVSAAVLADFKEPSELVVFDFSSGTETSPEAVVLVSVLVVLVVLGEVDFEVFVVSGEVLLAVLVVFGPPLASVFVVFADSDDEVFAVLALSVSEVFEVLPAVFPVEVDEVPARVPGP